MTDLIEDARRDVFEKQRHTDDGALATLLSDFLIFDTPEGRAVLRDLTVSYHDRDNPAIEEDVAGIDHPYRAYYAEGQRSVVRAIRAALREALQEAAQPTTEEGD